MTLESIAHAPSAGNIVVVESLVVTFAKDFTGKVRTRRYKDDAIGLRDGGLGRSDDKSNWEFLPEAEFQGYRIRNCITKEFWKCDTALVTLDSKDVVAPEYLFRPHFHDKSFFLQSLKTGQFATMENHKITCNRTDRGGWEAFSIEETT